MRRQGRSTGRVRASSAAHEISRRPGGGTRRTRAAPRRPRARRPLRPCAPRSRSVALAQLRGDLGGQREVDVALAIAAPSGELGRREGRRLDLRPVEADHLSSHSTAFARATTLWALPRTGRGRRCGRPPTTTRRSRRASSGARPTSRRPAPCRPRARARGTPRGAPCRRSRQPWGRRTRSRARRRGWRYHSIDASTFCCSRRRDRPRRDATASTTRSSSAPRARTARLARTSATELLAPRQSSSG